MSVELRGSEIMISMIAWSCSLGGSMVGNDMYNVMLK